MTGEGRRDETVTLNGVYIERFTRLVLLERRGFLHQYTK